MTQGELREYVWNTLHSRRAAAYPTPPHGHHPNFVGASRAAEKLMALEVFLKAETILAGPDQVLKPLREAILKSGKRLIMPHPDKAHTFLLLERLSPQVLKRVRDVAYHGKPIELHDTPIDLVLVGSVAVDKQFGWIGKGYGFPSKHLEAAAPWATLAHPMMLMEELYAEPERRIDVIATPLEVFVR
ncbi:5-formyltetrahydrofolate cyclo-ligase [Allomeiothermus silvanus]|uniref:5-formyltetrahydrofolate cyclo-ligase n=1 Tax=Allomeiothermus silvanus (strain ATCC 700542 / DSM 9946 / NBRC 106475 / NCIMB 13440 / VI-R2) TaxID=526227 RepID=D7BD69_ALLS1|nr:5-formyltetrahydrofolate cyclo-ligase [Allomeiothermus silvanus]ADH62987.1 5-formyltetrahydrofolate cyclo-ligase [Allomeiothermus silvanus DSM 9946]